MAEVDFPCLSVRLVSTDKITPNDYNPNRVAAKELELLICSIKEDGLTQPIVVYYDSIRDRYIIVDGFHRYRVLVEHFKCKEIPVTIIDKPLDKRMASTIRHNRARGKHQVDLVAEDIVKALVRLGWSDEQIMAHLGMTEEELVRLKQVVGIARMFANPEYSKSWGEIDD